jgi:hypothetical protein
MQVNSKYSVVSIRSYLSGDNKELGEDVLTQILSEFSCEKNPDVDRFLKKVRLNLPRKINLLHIWYFLLMMVLCWGFLRLR